MSILERLGRLFRRSNPSMSTMSSSLMPINGGILQSDLDAAEYFIVNLKDATAASHAMNRRSADARFATISQGELAANAIPKVPAATVGNLLEVATGGVAADSGKKTSDFASIAQGSLAETALQPTEIPENDLLASSATGGLKSAGLSVDPDEPGVLRGIYLPRQIAESDATTVPLAGEVAVEVDSLADPTRFSARLGDGVTVKGKPLGSGYDRTIIVDNYGTDLVRGAALRRAYALAKTMSPTYESPVWIVLPPGVYDVSTTPTSTFTLDTQYINLTGLIPAKLTSGRYASSCSAVINNIGTGEGDPPDDLDIAVAISAQNVRISDIEIKGAAYPQYQPQYPDPFHLVFVVSQSTGVVLERVRAWSDKFRATGSIGCTCVGCSFDGVFNGYDSTLSGSFTDCYFGNSMDALTYATLSGTFDNCVLDGSLSGTTISGTIKNSRVLGGFDAGGTISGSIINSTMTSADQGGTISVTGLLLNNTILSGVFGGVSVTGKMVNCYFVDNADLASNIGVGGSGFVRNCTVGNGTVYNLDPTP